METVRTFSSETAAYKQAFETFLQNTNQKSNLYNWLETTVKGLPNYSVYIDVGAGEGGFTKRLASFFQKTIAIEPNPHLLAQLQQALPEAMTLPQTIMEAKPQALADFILCSHVLYYIPQSQWLPNIERLMSWLAPNGLLVLVLQDCNTDCMQMLQHFFGQNYNLSSLVDELQPQAVDYHIQFAVEPAEIKTKNLADTYTIAEFMLNLLPIKDAPIKQSVEEYINKHFTHGEGYTISCDQGLLQIRKIG